MYLLSVVAFALIFAVPLLPGMFEILKPRDEERLKVNAEYTRDPHFFGNSMRSKVAPLLEKWGAELPYDGPFLGRGGERVHVDEEISVASKSTTEDVLVALDRVEINSGASLLDAYGMRSVEASDGISARTLLSDGSVRLGDGCRIGRWVDAGGTLSVGKSCNLGRSAISEGRMTLGVGTRFTRLSGMPILTGDPPPKSSPGHDASLEPGDVVGKGDLRIEAGRSIGGTVKAYGSLTIGAGAFIGRNVIARGNVTIEEGARVIGHVFAEGRLAIGPAVCIGLPESIRTAYGSLGIQLAPSAQIFGWLITDKFGMVG